MARTIEDRRPAGAAGGGRAAPASRLRVGLALIAVAVAACGGGSTSPSPPATPGSPAPTASRSTAAGLVLSTSAFVPGGAIPRRFTCDGDDVSPPLAWTGAPNGTAAFVLLVDDPDAGGFVHWVVGPIPASSTNLPEALTAAGPPDQGRNDFGSDGWRGPCPPSGTHHYVFRLVALADAGALPTPPTGAAIRAAVSGALGVAELSGTYARP